MLFDTNCRFEKVQHYSSAFFLFLRSIDRFLGEVECQFRTPTDFLVSRDEIEQNLDKKVRRTEKISTEIDRFLFSLGFSLYGKQRWVTLGKSHSIHFAKTWAENFVRDDEKILNIRWKIVSISGFTIAMVLRRIQRFKQRNWAQPMRNIRCSVALKTIRRKRWETSVFSFWVNFRVFLRSNRRNLSRFFRFNGSFQCGLVFFSSIERTRWWTNVQSDCRRSDLSPSRTIRRTSSKSSRRAVVNDQWDSRKINSGKRSVREEEKHVERRENFSPSVIDWKIFGNAWRNIWTKRSLE